MDKLTSLLLLAAAHEDLGIYPAQVVADGKTTQRTPWQEGWNSAVMAMTRKWRDLRTWCADLPDEHQRVLAQLLASDAAMLSLDDDEPTILLSMNDTFGRAVADSEEVPLPDLFLVADLWRDFGNCGLVGYAAAKRGAEPLAELRTPAFAQARQRCLDR